MKREHRLLSHRTPNSKSNHIVEESLNRRSQLIDKYQNQTQELIDQMENKGRKQSIINPNPRRQIKNSRASSNRRQVQYEGGSASIHSMKDFQKLILGLEYALEGEKQQKEHLEQKNKSLEIQISNLRNLLVGPNQSKHYEKTIIKEGQDKVGILQNKLAEQKKNYQFIIDSKNEALASLESELRTVQKEFKQENKDNALGKKILELMGSVQELRNSLTKKNIILQKFKFHKAEANESDIQSEEQIIEIHKQNKIKYYSQQLQISNKLILRKNIEILNLSNKNLKNEEVLDVIEQYLDKKQVKNVELTILQHPAITKLRVFLRQKVVFERQLLNQLNEHNKKINSFQNELVNRDSSAGNKLQEVTADNKRLASLVQNLQNNIKNLQKSLDDQTRECQILRSQIEINKKQFIQDIKKLKDQLNSISSVTKSQFDRMKIENLKLSEQNRSLLFLVGQKQKQIHKKGQAIRTFEDYKDKINNLNVGEKQKRKIDNVSQDNPQIGSKLLLINTFSSWLSEWNKVKNWNNKKVLLNLILDKQEIRNDALSSFPYLIGVIHESFLSSKNIQIQERAIILLSMYIQHQILKNQSLYLDKLTAIMVRGFRQKLQGEDDEKHRQLNESCLKVFSQLQKNGYKWKYQMTNEMLSVNGLRYLFSVLTQSKVDTLVEQAFNTLIMIAKANEMISFMNSFNVTTVLLQRLDVNYPFVIFALDLMKTLLESQDYIKSHKNLLEFRKLFDLLKSDDDEETIDLSIDCLLLLMNNSLFIKSLNKIENISILSSIIRTVSQFKILKKVGKVYTMLIQQLESQNIPKYIKSQLDKLLQIVGTKKFNENRFNRVISILLHVTELITDSSDCDEKIFIKLAQIYQNYDSLPQQTKSKLNATINIIFQRNKQLVNKHSNEPFIVSMIECYKQTNINEEIIFFQKMMQFQHQQKRTTQILRSGREALISKLINDSLSSDYNVAIGSLKNLLSISREKYAEKFVNKAMMQKIISKVLNSRNQEEYISLALTILYFFCKNEQVSNLILDCGLVQRICSIILEKNDKETLMFKCFSLLELCHSTNYKRKILNYFLSNDSNLKLLKTINHVLKKAKNKNQMGSRIVFLFDFFNNKTQAESLALLIESNPWMVESLIDVRNQYVGKVDSLVYKIQLLLHTMSTNNPQVKRIYQKFKVEGDDDSEDNS